MAGWDYVGQRPQLSGALGPHLAVGPPLWGLEKPWAHPPKIQAKRPPRCLLHLAPQGGQGISADLRLCHTLYWEEPLTTHHSAVGL